MMAIWVADSEARLESRTFRCVNAEEIFGFGVVGVDLRPHLDGIL